MPLFRYQALDAAGQILAGEMEAASRAVVIERLQGLGHLPMRVETPQAEGPAAWLHRDLFQAGTLPRRDLAVITHELATLLQAGIPLDRALEIVAELVEGRGPRQVLSEILERVRAGAGFADAVASQGRHFPPLYIGMVRAGDLGGALDMVLFRLADYLTKSQAVRDSIASAMIYPVLLLVVAGLSLVLVLTVVLPQFAPMFAHAGAALPLPTRIVMATGDAVRQDGWAAVLTGAVLFLCHRHALRRPSYAVAWHRLLLRLPLAGNLIVKAETARFSRTLGTLHGGGVPLTTALAITGGVLNNKALTRAVEAVATRLREGEGLAAPLAATNLFPLLATQLMRVGEETGQLDGMLVKLADIYDRDVQRNAERLLAMLTPLLTILLGLLIAGVIVSVLVAILSLNELAL